MLPNRRLVFGIVVSLMILLFYLSETAFWQEYVFSPQVVVWDGEVWLVYARNPLFGQRSFMRVRSLQTDKERFLQVPLGAVCVAGKYFVVAQEGLGFFPAEVLRKGGEAVFGVALPSGWRVSGLWGGEEGVVYAGLVSETGMGVVRIEPRPDATPLFLFTHKPKRFHIALPVQHKERVLAVCLDDEGVVYLADEKGVSPAGVPRCRAIWAAWLQDGLHLFCVPRNSLYELVEFLKKGETFEMVKRYEGRFSWLFGRRILLDVNGCVFKGKPYLVTMFGGVVAVGYERFRQVLGPSFPTRFSLLFLSGLLLLTLAMLILTSFRRKGFAQPKPLPPAGTLPRILAYIIDSFIVGFGLAPVAFFLGVNGEPIEASFALALPVQMIYFICCEAIFGRTVGKSIMGLRVVDEGGRRAGFVQILVRNITRLVVLVEGPVLLVFGKRFGDWLSVSRVAVWRRENAEKGRVCDKGMVSVGRGETEEDDEGVDGGGEG